MSVFKSAAFAALFSVAAVSAHAATVATAGTQAGGAFTIEGGGTTVAVGDPSNAWILSATDIPSEWIWDKNKVPNYPEFTGTFGGPVTFLYSFSLAGYNAATAVLSGLISMDDIVTVTLNGHKIFEDTDAYDNGSNWGKFQDYGTADSSFFTSGDNVLAYTVTNTGAYPAGLRATVTVNADASPVPLPAALPLLAAALGGFGIVGMRRKRA